jgi:hypothetical protein
MLKLAVIGAQTLLGRELVQSLEPQECSVLPLSTGVLTEAEEDGDLVVFAPELALMEGLDVVILADTPADPELLTAFPGRILDLRPEAADPKLEPMPLSGAWPDNHKALRVRPALDQVLAILPSLVEGLGDISGTHLCSVACLGDRGLNGLMEQTLAVLNGEEPPMEKLNYRAAFEVVPQSPRGSLIEVRVPAFHGDLLILHLRANEGALLIRKDAPAGAQWVERPPSNRDVAVASDLLAYLSLSADGRAGVLTLGFDPILWGVLRPTLRLLGL